MRWNSAEHTVLDLDAFLGKCASVMSAGHPASGKNNRGKHALVRIGCAGHDLYRPGSDIHLADHQMVSIRMLLDRSYLSDHNIFQIFIQYLVGLTFCSGKRHPVKIFLRGDIKIRYVFFYP